MTLSKHVALAIGFLGFVVVALVDAVLSPRVSLVLLHLLPVLFVTWFAGARWGVFFAVAMTLSLALSGEWNNPELVPRGYWYLDIGSDFIAILLLVWMQTRLRSVHEEVTRLARHDGLTGCLNRSGFYQALQTEIDRGGRYGHPFSLVYFDCDNFKFVNDTHGHHVGDALLVRLAEVLRSRLRNVDTVSRLGGDEFAVLLPESGADAAEKTVTMLKKELDASMLASGWPVTFSMGVATFLRPPEGVDKAMESADVLMYEVKRGGKDNIVFRTV